MPTPVLTVPFVTRSAAARISSSWSRAGRTRWWPRWRPAAPRGRRCWTRSAWSPGADVAAVTTVQIREVVERLVDAGQSQPGDPEVLVALDAGYDAPRIAHLLDGLPVQILGRLRSDRVMRRPTPPRVYDPKGGRPPKHGGEFAFGDPATWGTEQAVTSMDTRLYGKATAQAWDRLHPRLTRRAAWLDYDGPLPIIEGTVVRLVVEKLPSGGVNKPVWLWWSKTGATSEDRDRCWQFFLRRFDLEHTFRLWSHRPSPGRPPTHASRRSPVPPAPHPPAYAAGG
ncbi:transposase [Streptomyces sp. NPDC058637]|uniref:transposase n=1 Tax=Streptomyces sp. NPDC058637 TaxID=3346569 RepID=UPI00365337B3